MRKIKIDFERVNRLAQRNASNLIRDILPNGHLEGDEWVAINPHRADRSPGSFKININSGKWADFATNDRGGDFISLVAFVFGLRQSEAAKKINAMFGDG